MRTEVPIFPHVYETGATTLRQCRDRGLTDEQTALAVYLAMDELLHVTYLAAPEQLQ